MWPLGHAAGAYLLASVGADRDWLPRLDLLLIAALLVASQTPDLIDKPFAWFLPILPAGRSLGHSLLVIVPLCVVAFLLARRIGRPAIGSVVTIGLCSHLLLDVTPVIWGGEGWRYLFWPILDVDGFNTAPSITEMFRDSFDDPWFLLEVVFAALALFRWRSDGYPGVAWLLEGRQGPGAPSGSGDGGD